MKTLKKSLCLILALVFVLGLCTIGAGAANFTDKDEINYEDAVTVMQGLGILVGYPDGTFQPAKTVTRAEAAKMIAYMMLGEKYAEKLAAGSAFADVPETHWAAKYVNYCASKGIIKGYDNVHYGPNDPVTGIQLAKMLEVACGYGEMGEFGPDNWDVNAFTYAVETGIFEDAETEDFEAPASREETALYVFNTLTGVKQVKYDVDENKYIDYKAPFGTTVWNLVSTKLNGQFSYLTGNTMTGAAYTLVEVQPLDEDGDPDDDVDPDELFFKYDAPLELIGHQVYVYYDAKEQFDEDGIGYYEAYLIEDASTVVAGGGLIGETAVALGKKAATTDDFRYFYNYLEEDDCSEVLGKMQANFGTGKFLTNDNKKKNTSYVSLSGDFVLGEKGELISYIDSDYTVAKVTEVEEDYITVSNIDGLEESIEYRYVDVEVAVGDYVTVDFVGEKFYVTGTSTKTATIFEVGQIYLAGYFNFFTYSPFTKNYLPFTPVTAPEGVEFALYTDITVGSTVTFYLDSHGKWFAAVIDESGLDQGYVFAVTKYDVRTVDSYGVETTLYKAQCVDIEGNEVIYTLKDRAAYDAVTTPGVYKAIAHDDFTALTASGVSGTFKTKGFGKDTKVGTAYYLSNDVKVFYVNDKNPANDATIKYRSDLKVTESSILPQGDSTQLYFYAVADGTASQVPVIWLIDVPAPADYATSYVYVVANDAETHATNMPSGWLNMNGTNVYYYNVFIDGVVTLAYIDKVNNFAIYQTPACVIPAGFYKYSVNADGVTSLETATNVVNTTLGADATIYKGKLSVEISATEMIDEFDLSETSFYDFSSYTNSKGYLANISTLDQVTGLLANGWKLDVSFAVAEGTDGFEPVGTIYINRIYK